MQQYVVGFIFDDTREHVVLVHKRRPTFQAGLWNGVGGKLEPHETSLAAIQRECAEECDLHISDWQLCAHVCGRDYQIDFWSATCDLSGAKSLTDEPVQVLHVDAVRQLPTLDNFLMLFWICRDSSNSHKPIWIYQP
jgi:8-oxo-dGTP pyrophosphatase MutT (NUDIX family)